MFKWFKDTAQKSHGAVVAQNLIEMHAKSMWLHIDAAKVANEIVGAVWDAKTELFDGRFGQRPHKLSVAASAFAYQLERHSVDREAQSLFAMCLGTILQELELRGNRYPLNGIDQEILGDSAMRFVKFSQEFNASPLGQEIKKLLREDGTESK